MTRTRVAQAISLACAHHMPCVISMRSCCVFDSLRLLHFPLFAVYLLSHHPVFPLGHQLHLPRCGGPWHPCRVRPSHSNRTNTFFIDMESAKRNTSTWRVCGFQDEVKQVESPAVSRARTILRVSRRKALNNKITRKHATSMGYFDAQEKLKSGASRSEQSSSAEKVMGIN